MNPFTHLKIARKFASLLDNKFSFLGIKFGLDPLISAIPVVGDFFGLILSMYIVYIAVSFGLPANKIVFMIINAVFDFLLGSIPFLGLFADIFYGANMRNLKILESECSGLVFGEVVQ